MKKVWIFAALAAVMALILILNIVGYCGVLGDDISVHISSPIIAAVIFAGCAFEAVYSYLKTRGAVFSKKEKSATDEKVDNLDYDEQDLTKIEDIKGLIPGFNSEFWEEINAKYKEGDERALVQLAFVYSFGSKDLGIRADRDRAIRILKEGVDKNSSCAILYYGNCIQYGIGVKKNVKKAFRYYLKSAEMGLSFAQGCVGNCYTYGVGVERNYNEAVYWYKKCAEQGNRGGLNALGICYSNGIGVPQDY